MSMYTKRILDWNAKDVLEWLGGIGVCKKSVVMKKWDVVIGKDIEKGMKYFYDNGYLNDCNVVRKWGEWERVKIGVINLMKSLRIRKKERVDEKFVMILKKKLNMVDPKCYTKGNECFEVEDELWGLSDKEEIMRKGKVLVDDLKVGKIQIVKIALVLTHRLEFNNPRLSKILSNILNRAHINRFGLYHVGIIVGKFYYHWTTKSFITPKNIKSNRSYFIFDAPIPTVDMKKKDAKKRISTIQETVADVIVKWNTKYEYVLFQYDCHYFVHDILKNLGIESKCVSNSKLIRYNIRNGTTCLYFVPNHSFIVAFKMRNRRDSYYKNFKPVMLHDYIKFTFYSHEYLDLFIIALLGMNDNIKNLKDFSEQFPTEHSLLRGMDRAFWMRHFKNKEKRQYKPLEARPEVEALGFSCLFHDPYLTIKGIWN